MRIIVIVICVEQYCEERELSSTKYIVEYGDCECSHILEIFETKELAEEFLKPYMDLKAKSGKEEYDFIFGFYPSIREITVKDAIDDELKFIRLINRHGDKIYRNAIELYDEYFGLECYKNTYSTFTLDEDEALAEAEVHFAKYSDEDEDDE